MAGPTTWTTTGKSDPVTMESIVAAMESLTAAPVVTMVGGCSIDRLMVKLKCDRTRVQDWMSSLVIYHSHLLPADFLLIEEQRAGTVRLLVYRLRAGTLEAFEVMPEYSLYRVWRHIVAKYKAGN